MQLSLDKPAPHDATMSSPLVVSRVMRCPSKVLRVVVVLVGLFAVQADQPPCTDAQYLNEAGECASCPANAVTDDVSYTGADSCVCMDNFYYNAQDGSCTRCPIKTWSLRGENANISGCHCNEAWVGADGYCEFCGTGSFARFPDNIDVSDCMCNSDWYGPPGTTDDCTKCPLHSDSVRGSNADFESCICKRNYWGLGGGNSSECTKCPVNSEAPAGSADVSDCLCKNNWFGINGVCLPCPSGSASTKGSNFEISSCECPADCYMDGNECQHCPTNSKSGAGSVGIASCECMDNWYGSDGVCEQCPPEQSSFRGENSDVSGCKCKRDWVGPGGGEGMCTRCPGRSSIAFGENDAAQDTSLCTSCGLSYFGAAVLKNGGTAYDSGCERCPDLQLRTVVGDNANESDCFCPANGRFYEDTDEGDLCGMCPGRTRTMERPGNGIESCGCLSRSTYGPAAVEGGTLDCFNCEPFSKIEQALYDAGNTTTKEDCKCNVNYYGFPGETCVRCPAYTAVGPGHPDYYTSTAAQGATEATDCACSRNFYGPVPRPDPSPHASAWINEFHYDNVGTDTNEFIEIVSLDWENLNGYQIVLYSGADQEMYGDVIFVPEESGTGYTFTSIQLDTNGLQNGGPDPDAIALVNLDNNEVLEFICYDGPASSNPNFTAIDGPASGAECVHIGLRQTASTPEGSSVHRVGVGSYPEDFQWELTPSHSQGSRNKNQRIVPPTAYECRKCPESAPFSVKGANAVETDCMCVDNWYKDEMSGVCSPCPSNSVSFAGSNVGIESCQCKNGAFLDGAGECTPCPEGRTSIRGSNVGESSCTCKANWYGDSECQPCPSGGKSLVGDNADLSKCSCPANHYGINAGETCAVCPEQTKTITHGLGINVLEDSCSCPENEYGPGYGDCQECPDGSKSKPGFNLEIGSCACPDGFYGPGVGDCTRCPLNGTSTNGRNRGVYSCQCPAGFAMAYDRYVDSVLQAPTCVRSSVCDGMLDMISGKCMTLLLDTKSTWSAASDACQAWSEPDAFLGDPDYVPTPGHLASIVTRADLDMAITIFDDFNFNKDESLWIGAGRQTGEWEWSDGSAFSFVEELWGPDDNGDNRCGRIIKRWLEPGTNQYTPLLDDTSCNSRMNALCSKSPNPCVSGNNECSDNAECVDRDFGTGYFGYKCECHFGYLDVYGNGTLCQEANITTCDEVPSNECHHLAFCHVLHLQPDVRVCSCPEGLIGDGVGPNGCSKTGYTVRAVIDLPEIMPAQDISNNKLTNWEYCKVSIARLFFDVDTVRPPWFEDAMHHHITGTPEDGYVMTVNGLFATEADANNGLAAFSSWQRTGVYACTTSQIDSAEGRRTLGQGQRSLVLVSPGTVLPGTPGVYRWVAGATDDPLRQYPTGFEVEAVYFDSSCMASGCWVVDVIYTRGRDNFVSFFIPHALRPNGADNQPLLPGEAGLSVDYNYDVIPASDDDTSDSTDFWYWDWRKSPHTTFFPENFPCGSNDYNPATSPEGNPPMKMTACCIMEFRQTYRPVKAFYDATMDLHSSCTAPSEALLVGDRSWNVADPAPMAGGAFPTYSATGTLPADGLGALGDDGLFAGMALSRIDPTGVVDPYIGQFRARVQLDELELREKAGKLRGTPGVEHTVDTFLGLAEFKPTPTGVLDSFATQAAIHLEKTAFFTASTHGVNDYTFLEYINLRLVAVYSEDTDPTESVAQNGERTARTGASGAAHYVQVTFTMGSQYQPIETGLIPLDSVRVGQGTFMAQSFTGKDRGTLGMVHACDAYAGQLDSLLGQPCAPNASMCASPSTVPDHFVVFNIPLGIDWLPASPQGDLSENVFVNLVVSAIDTVATGSPNSGDDPQQMKTTLTASIPVVEGGVNIFCDGFTAKTDLVDVVQVHLIVGSATDASELSRLRIFENIANSDLTPTRPSQFATDSIEAGLMTLVVEGNRSYFEQGGTSGYRVNVEDVITVHVMEPASSKYDEVQRLLGLDGEDNNLADGLDTDGYKLNGAFEFTIDRAQQRAYLNPTEALLEQCAFNPPRPTLGDPFPVTCVIRRDVFRQSYPARVGGHSTAAEIPAKSSSDRHANGVFMTTMLGDSDYAYSLGGAFSQLVADTYDLNGRYKRAFMINPGYEWTPSQTGGQEVFAVSQKILVFVLINLDEGFSPPIAPSYTLPTSRPRRMLLTSTTATGASVAGVDLAFGTTPTALLATSLGFDPDRVAVIGLTLSAPLTVACQAEAPLAEFLKAQVLHLVGEVANGVQAVVVLSSSVEMLGLSCTASRRSLRRNSASVSAAMEVLVAFSEGQTANLDLEALRSKASVLAVEAIDVSPKVSVDTMPEDAGQNVVAPASLDSDSSSSSSIPAALIVGVTGGVGGVMCLAAGLVLVLRSRNQRASAATETACASSLTFADLKVSIPVDA